MTTYGPFNPSSVSGDGWQNTENAMAEGGEPAVYAGCACDGPELRASFEIAVSERAKKITVATVDALAVSQGFTSPALDSIQLMLAGVPFGEQQGHQSGIPMGTCEFVFDVDLSPSELATLGVLVAFWDSMGEPSGSTVISIDSLKIVSVETV